MDGVLRNFQEDVAEGVGTLEASLEDLAAEQRSALPAADLRRNKDSSNFDEPLKATRVESGRNTLAPMRR